MTYRKPQLVAYSAVTVIQGSKIDDEAEMGQTAFTQPAYEADE